MSIDDQTISCHRPVQCSPLPISLFQATQARDALAKCIYSNLFDWIGMKEDKLLPPPPQDLECINSEPDPP